MEPRKNDRYIDYIHSYNYSTLQDLPHTRTHMSLRLCSCLPSTLGSPLTVWTIWGVEPRPGYHTVRMQRDQPRGGMGEVKGPS